MEQISVYLNKQASNANSKYWQNKISKPLFRSNVIFHAPDDIETLRNSLKNDLECNVDKIISVGGDGTMNLMIQELAYQDVSYLVIPGGTANDLSSELNLSSDIKKAVQCIRHKKEKLIDLINVNGRYMATNGGLGVGADVTNKINEIRAWFPLFKDVMKMSGDKIYSLFLAKELASLKLQYYTIEVESGEFSGVVETPIMLINNQKVLGGSFSVAPNTTNDDGTFNVTIFTHKSRVKLIEAIAKITLGKYPKDDKELISFETKLLNISNLSEQTPKFFGDGECFSCDTDRFKISIAPAAIRAYSACLLQDTINSTNEVFLQ